MGGESDVISKDEEQQHRQSDGRVGGRDEVDGEATRSLWVAGSDVPHPLVVSLSLLYNNTISPTVLLH